MPVSCVKKGATMSFESVGGIDLHIHSNASDGTFSPQEIVRMAVDKKLRAIAITDHDTLAGSRSVLAGPIPDHLHFLTGVEISTAAPAGFQMGGSLHILGYGVDPAYAPLEKALAGLQKSREERIPRIIDLLNRTGIAVTLPEVTALVGDGCAGRPHVAQALIRAGAATDVNDAFDRYLAKGQPAYVEKRRLDCRVAIDLIRAAGGIAVLAHPYLVPGGRTESLIELLEPLCDMGLTGIEAYYSRHTAADVAFYLDLAGRYDLMVTGGTDFHGDLIPDIEMGSGLGDLFVPFSLYEALVLKIEPEKAV